MQTYIAFTYSSGQTGYVLAEALKTFKKKDAAVQTALQIQGKPVDKDGMGRVDRDALDKAMRSIIAANRAIKSKGWFFIRKAEVDHLVSLGRATIQGA